MPHFGWYFLTYLVPLFFIVGVVAENLFLIWFVPIWMFVITPLLDHYRGVATGNVKPERENTYTRSLGYNAVVWFWVPLQTLLLLLGLVRVADLSLNSSHFLGLAISTGLITGAIGITWAHELCHRTNKIERALAEILLSQVLYAHFAIEHVYGHHKNVATPVDPATSRYGQSFYRFLPQTLIGSFLSAWRIENRQLDKKGKGFLSFENRMLRYMVIQSLMLVISYLIFGLSGLVFLIIQAGIAILLLELINYLEHYGLVRKQNAKGRYERVQPWHSWNSSNIISNLSLINLARHSDHHFIASRPYQILRHFEEAPQLPSGYSAMLMLALWPPLWFKIMNPHVKAWQEAYH